MNDRTGDVIALVRLTLAGDIKTSTEMLNALTGQEMMQSLAISIGFTAMALKLLGQTLVMPEEEVLNRLIKTNEKMRNGDI